MTAGGPVASAPLTHGRSAPDACSVQWDSAVGETAYGTAAPAKFWVAVEQNGPWGRTAATESYLPHEVGDAMTRRCALLGGRFVLIRRPGTHADPREGTRRCYVGWSGPGAYLLVGEVGHADDLLTLDLVALARGDEAATAASLPSHQQAEPVLLVCTNGRHDVCCAVRGRPVALAGHSTHPGRVWECSHTGGHRFSPTGVLLPWGRTVARLDGATADELVAASEDGRMPVGLTGPWHDRGWSALPPRVQVAESSVRDLMGETDLEALTAVASRDGSVAVWHRDGHAWHVALSVADGPARRNSCAETPEPARTWAATVTQA